MRWPAASAAECKQSKLVRTHASQQADQAAQGNNQASQPASRQLAKQAGRQSRQAGRVSKTARATIIHIGGASDQQKKTNKCRRTGQVGNRILASVRSEGQRQQGSLFARFAHSHTRPPTIAAHRPDGQPK